MREAWRLNKHELYAAVPADRQLHLFCIFTDNAMPSYESVTAAMQQGIARIAVSLAGRAGEADNRSL